MLSSLALFWNLDTGIVILGTWFITLSYETIVTNSLKDKKTYIQIVKYVIMTVMSVIIYLLLINILAFVRTGKIVGIMNLIYGQSNFIGSGYYMIKMELWHPWLILAIVYIIGLVVPLSQIKKRDENISNDKLVKYIAILAVTILGCGIFTYYQGRSHNSVFYSVLYPAIILVAIYLDYLICNLDKIKGINKNISKSCILVVFIALSIISLATIYSMINNEKIVQMYDKSNISSDFDYKEMDKLNEIIDNLQYLGDNEPYFYIRYRREDIKKMPGYIDLFTYEDCKKIIDILEDTHNLYVNGNIYDKVLEKYPELYEKILEKYNVYTNGNNYVILEKEIYDESYFDKLAEIEFLILK